MRFDVHKDAKKQMKLKTDNDEKQVERTRYALMTKFFLSVSLIYRDHAPCIERPRKPGRYQCPLQASLKTEQAGGET
jgi:hypothetical protein